MRELLPSDLASNRNLLPVRSRAERGMTTAEYAVGTVAAVGFAGLLVALLSSDEVRELLMNIVRSALGTFG